MMKTKHVGITVNTDEMKQENFEGELSDFACVKLDAYLEEHMPDMDHIISIESSYYSDEMRPVKSNSCTWYRRSSLHLSVWVACHMFV